jgi:hypothetical protein
MPFCSCSSRKRSMHRCQQSKMSAFAPGVGCWCATCQRLGTTTRSSRTFRSLEPPLASVMHLGFVFIKGVSDQKLPQPYPGDEADSICRAATCPSDNGDTNGASLCLGTYRRGSCRQGRTKVGLVRSRRDRLLHRNRSSHFGSIRGRSLGNAFRRILLRHIGGRLKLHS